MSDDETLMQPAPGADDTAGKKKDKKGKKAKKGKKGKKGASAEGLTVAGHPRAGVQVRMAKGWGGLIAFGVTAYLSLSAGLTPDQVGLRALGAGIGGYLLGWACSVTVWRHLLIAELRALADHANDRHTAPAGQISLPTPAPAEAPEPTGAE